MDVTTVKQKVMKLRQMACGGIGPTFEPLRLFHEISGDPKCRQILTNAEVASQNEEILHYYNLHIQRSFLSEKDKEQLTIWYNEKSKQPAV